MEMVASVPSAAPDPSHDVAIDGSGQPIMLDASFGTRRDRLRNVPSLERAGAPAPRDAGNGMTAAMLDASPDCIKYVELDGTLSLMNANGMCAMQIDDFCMVDGKEWASLWPEDAQPTVRAAVISARGGRTARFEAFCPTAKGDPRWWDVTVAPILGNDGRPTGIVSISRDVTAAVRDRRALAEAKEEAELALREVNHRVKNLFAVVPAIMQLSARVAPDVRSLVEAVRDRIGALARSHSLTLGASSEGEGVVLGALTRAVLEPYLDRAEAFQLTGPSLRLTARDANVVSLTLHELATNAAKHGALSAPDGRITIDWRVDRTGPDADDALAAPMRLVLGWSEAGGPPVAGAPTRQGFGTSLIDRLVMSHGGRLERHWNAGGLSVGLELPLHGAVAD